MWRDHVEHLGRETARLAHALNLFRTFDNDFHTGIIHQHGGIAKNCPV